MLKSSIVIFCLAAAIVTAAPLTGYGQSASTDAREEQLYKNGTAATRAEQWQNAIDQFSQVKGSNADGAMYWKAFAENKLGQQAAALETIGLLTRQYPRSTWVNEAKALEIEIRGASGQASPAATANDDDDLKLLALNSLLAMNSETAVPMLEKLLDGSASARVKDRALFVLSQSGSARAQDLMANIARGQIHPELQMKAVQNLGVSGNKKVLSDINAGGSAEAKRAALRAMGIAGARDELLTAARSEQDPQLRREAINGLAVTGGRDQLRQLYKEATDPQERRDLLRTAVITGDQELLTSALQNDSDPEIKRDAVRSLGVTGGSNAIAALVNIYSTDKDKGVREAALDGLFVHGAAHELVELAKKETDPEMKTRLVSKLGIMNNKEATDFLIQLLEK